MANTIPNPENPATVPSEFKKLSSPLWGTVTFVPHKPEIGWYYQRSEALEVRVSQHALVSNCKGKMPIPTMDKARMRSDVPPRAIANVT